MAYRANAKALKPRMFELRNFCCFKKKEICQMKSLFRITIYGAFSMALLGSALGQNIQTDFDHQTNFSQYKSYSWQAIKAADSLWQARIQNAVNGQLAAKGLTETERDNRAEPKSPTQARPDNNGAPYPFPPPPQPPPGAADLPALPSPPSPSAAAGLPTSISGCATSASCVVIVAFQTTHDEKSLQAFFNGMNGWGGWGAGGMGEATITPRNYKEGTLVIDMYDAKTKQLIWQGSAEGTLSDKADKNEKNLNKAVAKMFKNFPPGSTIL
jgi:hypothetical protein